MQTAVALSGSTKLYQAKSFFKRVSGLACTFGGLGFRVEGLGFGLYLWMLSGKRSPVMRTASEALLMQFIRHWCSLNL